MRTIRHSCVIIRFCRVRATIRESSSKIKEVGWREKANLATSKAVRASPWIATQGGLIKKLQWVIIPEESLMTSAWA